VHFCFPPCVLSDDLIANGSKQFQKTLTKQGIKFKLNTKVISADRQDGKVYVKTQDAKGDKEETVSAVCSVSEI
jgi:pyruvate/2-oxoglutarate dehydrogenase complex dihydrolipoamide dehydrogenase (E3) component